MNDIPGLLRFKEGYFDRIWGGSKLREVLGLDTPPGKVVGEAWLVSDHAHHESVVSEGRLEGKSLRELLGQAPRAILGSRARLTIHGRFPLLLKLLDSAQPLSVQVHPDDDDAKRLGEPDVGKTEMWHVFHAEPGSELICGLHSGVKKETFAQAVEDGSIENLMMRFEVAAGTSAFVAAGMVHAIGSGILLAEIQQNSDLTYRIYDWGRLQPDGTPRELHIGKALEVIHFGSVHGGPVRPLSYSAQGASCSVLAACRYFAAELVYLTDTFERDTRGESFHILLAKSGELAVADNAGELPLRPGQAVLVSGHAHRFTLTGRGECLDYYVPDLERDIITPLRDAGHLPDAIVRLGGDPATSDLRV